MSQPVSGGDVMLNIDSVDKPANKSGFIDPLSTAAVNKSQNIDMANKSGFIDPVTGRRLTISEGKTGRVLTTAPVFIMEHPIELDGMIHDAPDASARVPDLPASGMAARSQRDLPNHPYPQWPANWKTGVFESTAPKKSLILSPPEIYAECVHHGAEKGKWSLYKMLMLCMTAGFYVGFGFTLCLQVGGLLNEAPGGPIEQRNLGLYRLVFGAVGFPFAFTTIIVCGADLYTSLCAYMMCAWWEGKSTFLNCLRVWFVSWWGNFLGCAIMVGLFHASGIWDHGNDRQLLIVAASKTSHPWGQAFVRGIFANWLVGLATWQANAAQDLTGKFVGIWLPISAFAMIGFEHCIANQFVLIMALAEGSSIDALHLIWYNLIPATLGNWIGGGICVGTLYAFIYGRPPVVIHDYVSKLMKKNN